MARTVSIFALLIFLGAHLVAGPNENAAIVFDYNLNAGDQGVTSIDAPGIDAEIRLEIRVKNCSTLDSYSFELRYKTSDLQFTDFSLKNLPKEDNILNQKGSYLFDAPIQTVDASGEIGVISVSVVNTTNDPTKCPSGDGLLGKVTFYTKVAAPLSIQFGQVVWKDPGGVTDICKPENKGEFFMGGGSLPVELSSFTARTVSGGVLLQWSTESETNSYGFHVLRSLTEKDGFEQVTPEPIRAAGVSTHRREYQWLDRRVEAGVTYYYKLQQLDIDGSSRFYGPVRVSVTSGSTAPSAFRLYPAFPNPFNPATNLSYDLPTEAEVKLEVFDVNGRRVRVLDEGHKVAGAYSATWDGTDAAGKAAPAGTYFCRLTAGSSQEVIKVMLLR